MPSARKEVNPCPPHLERGKPTRRSNATIWVRSKQTPLLSPSATLRDASRSPKGEKPKHPQTNSFLWKTITIISRPAPFPHRPRRGFGMGGGIGPSQTLYSPEMIARIRTYLPFVLAYIMTIKLVYHVSVVAISKREDLLLHLE